jgi:hypothetical protein
VKKPESIDKEVNTRIDAALACHKHSTKCSCKVLLKIKNKDSASTLKCEISIKFRIFTNLPELEIFLDGDEQTGVCTALIMGNNKGTCKLSRGTREHGETFVGNKGKMSKITQEHRPNPWETLFTRLLINCPS